MSKGMDGCLNFLLMLNPYVKGDLPYLFGYRTVFSISGMTLNINFIKLCYNMVFSLLSRSLRLVNSELQIKVGIEDNSKIIFLISQQNICCDSSLEPS